MLGQSGWALVGDAGYAKDPATAHRTSDAFLDAQRLAFAVAVDLREVSINQAERDWMAPPLFRLTHEIASLDWDFDRLKARHMVFSRCVKADQRALIPTPIAYAA